MRAKLARRAFLSLPLAASALAAGEVKRVEGIKLRIAINAYSFNRPLMAHSMTLDDVLDYCAAVRGILNDDQGGPLHPPGLRMAEALTEVRASLQRNLDAKKGGTRRSN